MLQMAILEGRVRATIRGGLMMWPQPILWPVTLSSSGLPPNSIC